MARTHTRTGERAENKPKVWNLPINADGREKIEAHSGIAYLSSAPFVREITLRMRTCVCAYFNEAAQSYFIWGKHST